MSQVPDLSGQPNPYQSPAVTAWAADDSGQGSVTPRTVELLERTRPWVLLISILVFIMSGLMFVGGVAVLLMAVAGHLETAQGGVIAAMYIPMAAIYLAPAAYRYRYARAIRDLSVSRHTVDLENALSAQKSFWKFMGILSMVAIAFYGLAILAFIFVAAFASRL